MSDCQHPVQGLHDAQFSVMAFLKPSRRQCAYAESTDNDCQLASHRHKKNTYGIIFALELHLSACTPNTLRTCVLDFDPPLAGGPHGQEELRAAVSIIMQQLRQVQLLPGFGCHFPEVQPLIIASCFCQFCEAAVVFFAHVSFVARLCQACCI